MATLAFDDEYDAVDAEPGQVRANADRVAVAARARRQLADLWGPDWRPRLARVLGEVSDVWWQRTSWACLSGDTLVVLSASGRTVVGVRPRWWRPDELRTALEEGRFSVADDLRSRLADQHGEGLWPEVLAAAVARLVRDGQLAMGPGRVRVSARRLHLWLQPKDGDPAVIGGHLRLPVREDLRSVLRAGDVTASHSVTTRLQDQFGGLWHDVLRALCGHLADAVIPRRARVVPIRDDTGAGVVIHAGHLVAEVYFGRANTRVRTWTEPDIRAALMSGTSRVSRKLAARLADELGPASDEELTRTARSLAVSTRSEWIEDPNGKVVHVADGSVSVTVERHTPVEVTLAGRPFPTIEAQPRIVNARLTEKSDCG